MATVMASRFSVLKIEDDSDQEREKAARKKAAEDEKNKKKLTKKKKKSKPAETQDAELQSMAFGLPKPKKQPKPQKASAGAAESPRKPSESDQSEWERRDQALIDEAFERDLQQAMLMSRVDYEEREAETAAAPADAAPEPGKQRGKKAKPAVLSLDQLQSLSSEQIDKGDFRHLAPVATSAVPARPLGGAAGGDGADFFDQVEWRTKEAVTREKVIESIKRDRPPGPPPAASESASDLQLRLAARESELEELQRELERTRDELKLAKSRTKRVLSVLTQSETKEKVQLIVSLEKAEAAREAADRERADMSVQVTSLLAQLEQERSRVHQLTTQIRKLGNKSRRGQSENDTPDALD